MSDPNQNLYPKIQTPFPNQPQGYAPNTGYGPNGGAPYNHVGVPMGGAQPGQSGFFQEIGHAVNLPPSLTESPITQFGLGYGKQFFDRSQSYVNSHYFKSFSTLKYYFNVNNSYVINKLKLILFPLRHKYWKRRIQNDSYLPPRDDINAPDFYIPTMAFITYVLIIGFVFGTAFKFTPEVLGMTATRGLVVLMLEVLTIKFGFYLLNSLTVSILDVIAYCGYKYVGIVLSVLIGLVFGTYAFYGVMTVSSIFMAIFMVKTLKLVFPEPGQYDAGGGTSTSKRNQFLLGIAVLQLLLGYYLAYDIHVVTY